MPPLPDAPIPAAELGPGDTLAILYTSGTSGLSKGVCCPHAQFHWWGVIAARNLGIDVDDVLYTSLPLFHTNALNACFQALATAPPSSATSASRSAVISSGWRPPARP